MARPGVLRPGDRVRFDDTTHTVVGLSGTLVLLADEHAATAAIPLAELQARRGFAIVGARQPASVLGAVGLERLPAPVVERALWWQRHVAEVIGGIPPDAEPGRRPAPEFDLAVTSLTQRERATCVPRNSDGIENETGA